MAKTSVSTMQKLLENDIRWYCHEVGSHEIASIIQSEAQRIWRDHEATRRIMIQCENLYNSTQAVGLTPRSYRNRLHNLRQKPISFNGIQAVCDTYVALVTKDQPKISFLTNGEDWEVQKKAEYLERATDGTFYESKLHLTAQNVALDSAIHPFGVVQCYIDETRGRPRIVIERCHPWQILADDQDCYNGCPSVIYYIDYVDKLALCELYPEQADAIIAASTDGFDEHLQAQYTSTTENDHYCVVIEAYHMRASEELMGRHTVVVAQTVLEDEEYDEYTPPYKFLYRKRPRTGIYGQSLADELAPDQIQLMMLLAIAEKANKNVVGHWFIPRGAQVNTNKLDNVIGSFQEFSGPQPPVYVAATPASNDIYAHMDRIWSRMFERIGVSQMSAAGQKPAGLNSGKAMLVYADIQSQRFEPCYREYQHFYLEIAEYCLKLSAQIAKKYPDYEVKAPGKGMMAAIKWAEVHLEEHEYTLQLKPSNALAEDPAARLQVVQDMMNSGMISPQDGRRLLDLPDLEEYESYEDASYNVIMQSIGKIINDGDYQAPDKYMDLGDAIRRCQMAYLKARSNKVPEDRLGLLRRWMDQCNGLIPKPPPPPMPPPPGPGMAPGGPGQPMPPGPPGGPGGPPVPGMPGGIPGRTAELVQRGIAKNAAQNLG